MNTELATRAADVLARTFTGPGGRYLYQRGDFEGWAKTELTPAVFRRHVEGWERIGRRYDPERLSWACFDIDGKNHPEGRTWALATARRISEALADLGMPSILEQSRSGLGFHVWILFGEDGPPLAAAREFASAVLRALGFEDDFSEKPEAPGFYPWLPGEKECGRVPYLPWHGLANGSPSGLLCNVETGEPFDDQLAALESATRVSRDAFESARAAALALAPPPPKPERPRVERAPVTLPTTGELTGYGEDVLATHCEELASWPSGGNRLRRAWQAGCRVGELEVSGHLPPDYGRAHVLAAAEANGSVDRYGLAKVEKELDAGIERGRTNPPQEREKRNGRPDAPEEPAYIREEYGEAPEDEEPEPAPVEASETHNEDAAAVLYDGPTLPAECWRPGFAEFREAYSRTTEATDAFFFAGYAVAAGLMMGRNASLRCGEPVRPLFYCVNVGETGISRKTTAQNKASEAVTLADESVLTVPAVGSAEGLLEVMAEDSTPGMPSRRVLLNPSEFSSLLLKSNAEATRGLGPMLTTLWDLPLKYASPKAGNARSVTEPFLAILTSTTREWLHRDLTEDLLRGGLANRFLYFVGPEKAPIAFPPPPEPHALAEAMRVLSEARDRHGVFREYALSPEAETLYSDWYHARRKQRPESPVLAALSHRLHSNAWRVALVYAALEGTGRVTREQMAAAVALADYQAAAHRTVFEGYGDSEGAKLAERIRAALRKHGPLPTWRLAQIVRHVEPERLQRTITALATLGEIRARVNGKGKVWTLREAENTPSDGKVDKVSARDSARVGSE